MDRRERAASLDVAILAAITGEQAGLWTAAPGIIESFNATEQTCSVKLTTKARRRLQSGAIEWVEIPLLVDCPVVFPSGGGFTLTFPIAGGDECLVVFAARCIDAWWQSGGVQIPPDLRMHDLSDGFVIPGPRSKPEVISPPATSSGVELRNDARSCYVAIGSSGVVTVKSPTRIVLDAPSVIINGKEIVNHVHTGVSIGGSNTGPQP